MGGKMAWFCAECGRERTGEDIDSACPACAVKIDCPTCQGRGHRLPEDVAHGSRARYRRAVEARAEEWALTAADGQANADMRRARGGSAPSSQRKADVYARAAARARRILERLEAKR